MSSEAEHVLSCILELIENLQKAVYSKEDEISRIYKEKNEKKLAEIKELPIENRKIKTEKERQEWLSHPMYKILEKELEIKDLIMNVLDKIEVAILESFNGEL